MASRVWPRLYVMAHAAPKLLLPRRRERPEHVRRLLVAHHLLLGDTIMLTPLLKKARARFPDAEIVMTAPRAFAPLYAGKPYGVKVFPFSLRSVADYVSMRQGRGFDLALLPADNRWSWLARMLEAKWTVGFEVDRRTYKDLPVDEFVGLPDEPLAWGDLAAGLIQGDAPRPYDPGEWPDPPFDGYSAPRKPYCVFHMGASSPHKLWPADRWRTVLDWAEKEGYEVVLSSGPGEESLLHPVDPEGRRSTLAGRLDLPQLWHLLRNASFLVCPDTGVAHMARLVGTPTVAIYGPGSPVSTGPGRFWASSPFHALWDPDVACRDQSDLFGRRVTWVRQCWRTVSECGNPVCVRRVTVEQVVLAIQALVSR